jgi:hypothetical protein
MLSKHVTPQLTENLQRYFWDYDPGSLSGKLSRHTVVTRLLQEGGWDAVQWLRESVGDEYLRTMIISRRGRGISPKRLRFWELVLDLPHEQVDAWVAAQQANPWYRRAPR